jgi:hypothetical protein
MKTVFLLLTLVVLLMLASITLANTSANYTLTPDVIASGGQAAASTNYSFVATVGQPLIGASNSASYSTCVGFWCEIVGAYKVYLPIALKNS